MVDVTSINIIGEIDTIFDFMQENIGMLGTSKYVDNWNDNRTGAIFLKSKQFESHKMKPNVINFTIRLGVASEARERTLNKAD